MKDRAMQALYLLAVNPVAETTADHCSYGFRPGGARRMPSSTCTPSCPTRRALRDGCWKGYHIVFDRISHDWLLAHIPMDRASFRSG
jgi:RNA-directed DNA polymerase